MRLYKTFYIFTRGSLKNSKNYYPFGMEMAGRGFSGSYRFGYQGSEKDNEVSGDGNSYTTEFRQLDPRLGRWFSVDPVFQPWQSPYTSMDNNPIGLNDPSGLLTGDGDITLRDGDAAMEGGMFPANDVDENGNTVLTGNYWVLLKNTKTGEVHSALYDKDGNELEYWETEQDATTGEFKMTNQVLATQEPVSPAEVTNSYEDVDADRLLAISVASTGGFTNAAISDQAFGIGRVSPQDAYPHDKGLQLAYAYGQLSGDLSSVAASSTAGNSLSALATLQFAGGFFTFGATAVTGTVTAGLAVEQYAVATFSSAQAIVATKVIADINHQMSSEGNEVGSQGSGDGGGNGTYEQGSNHGSTQSGNKGAAPKDGQAGLDKSFLVKQKGNTSQRGAVEDDHFLIFDEHRPGIFHGHQASWSELRQAQKNAFINNGLTKPNGTIIK